MAAVFEMRCATGAFRFFPDIHFPTLPCCCVAQGLQGVRTLRHTRREGVIYLLGPCDTYPVLQFTLTLPLFF